MRVLVEAENAAEWRQYVLDRMVKQPNGCWEWQLSKGTHGYGQAWTGKTVTTAHRMAYLAFVGPIMDGLTVDHLCRNRMCCNPAHLRLLTNEDNARDNGFAGRTHCPHGHEYTPENTYCSGKPRQGRKCRTCANERRRKVK